jgi:hypothetical protein
MTGPMRNPVKGTDGQPLTVYHGTPRPGLSDVIDPEFDLSQSGSRTDHGNFGLGVYTTRHEWVAQGYAGREGSVIAMHVELDNPIRIPVIDGGYTKIVEEWSEALGVESKPIWEGNAQRSKEWASEFRDKALEAGYDGVITLNVDGEICAEVVAYRPKSLHTLASLRRNFVEVDGHHLPLNADGTVTLYHCTTKERAQAIIQTRELRSAAEPQVFMSTSWETEYGDGTAVAIDVNPKLLRINDEFPSGRADFAIDRRRVRLAGARIHVAADEPDLGPTPAA